MAPETITVADEGPHSADARRLMDELSAYLEQLTGSSGRGSFAAADVCGERAVFVVARDGQGNAVGCGALRPVSREMAELKRLYARTPAVGIGTALLAFLERRAHELGYTTLRLETRLVNTRAVSFYERHGYHQIPNYGRYANRPEAVCLAKRLSP